MRVVIAAHSSAALAGLASLLADVRDVDIVGRSLDAHEFSRLIDGAAPDVAVVEAGSTDDGSLLTVATDSASPHAPAVVVLTDDIRAFERADSRVRSGYAALPRTASPAELSAALHAAAAGLIVTHHDLVERARAAQSPGNDGAHLTQREVEVLRMLAAGLPNKSIARRLGVSPHTVKFHVGSIMGKLHAGSRTEAVTEGIRRGLIYV